MKPNFVGEGISTWKLRKPCIPAFSPDCVSVFVSHLCGTEILSLFTTEKKCKTSLIVKSNSLSQVSIQ